MVLNVILGTLNLFPIPPLDGSRVVGGFMPREMYKHWAALDRYGMYVFLGLFVVLWQVPAVYDVTFGRHARPVHQAAAGRVTVTGPGFEWRERDGVSWLAWEAGGVTAAFPARDGGVSAPPLDSLNLGLSVDEPRRTCSRTGAASAPPSDCRRTGW